MTATCNTLGRLGASWQWALAVPLSASAQSDKWDVDVAPLYSWTSEMDGRSWRQTARSRSSCRLTQPPTSWRAFSVHGEARKDLVGIFGDINFIRLSTDAEFSTSVLQNTVTETAQLDMTIVEGGAPYLLKPDAHFGVIGGVRSYTLSPKIELEGPVLGVRAVDATKTAVGVFGGFTYRPPLTSTLALLTQPTSASAGVHAERHGSTVSSRGAGWRSATTPWAWIQAMPPCHFLRGPTRTTGSSTTSRTTAHSFR